MDKSVLLVNDNHILCELLSLQLAQRGFSIHGYTMLGKEGVDLAMEARPSLILLSQLLPDMHTHLFIDHIYKHAPTRLVVLLHQPSVLEIQQLQEKGTDGLISTNISMGELFFCLEEVLLGKRYICNTINKLRHYKTSPPTILPPKPDLLQLTDREQQVMFLIAQGWTNRQIGEKLFLSEYTIGNHRTRIIKKLTIHGSHQLIRIAIDSQQFLQEKWSYLLKDSLSTLTY